MTEIGPKGLLERRTFGSDGIKIGRGSPLAFGPRGTKFFGESSSIRAVVGDNRFPGTAEQARIPQPLHGLLFGEDQARYVITVEEKMAQFLANNAADAGVQFRVLGNVGGDKLVVKDVLALDVAEMKTAHENWFPDYMA